MDDLTAVVGPHNAEVCPAIIHLSLADSAYSLLAPPTTEKEEEEMEVEG